MTRGDVVYINLPLVAESRVQGGRRAATSYTSNGRQHTIRQSNDDDCANDHYVSNGAISIHTSDRAFSPKRSVSAIYRFGIPIVRY